MGTVTLETFPEKALGENWTGKKPGPVKSWPRH